MIGIRVLASLGMLAILSHAERLGAQEAADTIAAPAADTAPKKKGGLFRKVKGIAGNKVVKSVAKTAACTMVPGGQVIAGAIDAAGSTTAGEAASGAAAAAGGTSCMPGMGGMGAGAPNVGATGLAGAAAAGMLGAGVGVPGGEMPMGYAPSVPGEAVAGPGLADTESMARCLGMSPGEYLDLTDPTRGQPRQPTGDEMKRQQRAVKKFDPRRYPSCITAASAGEPE